MIIQYGKIEGIRVKVSNSHTQHMVWFAGNPREPRFWGAEVGSEKSRPRAGGAQDGQRDIRHDESTIEMDTDNAEHSTQRGMTRTCCGTCFRDQQGTIAYPPSSSATWIPKCYSCINTKTQALTRNQDQPIIIKFIDDDIKNIYRIIFSGF